MLDLENDPQEKKNDLVTLIVACGGILLVVLIFSCAF
jgi:hypothetical protein